ncbi:GNAT family N-acetyltransferase [Micrococcus lylae]|uniref:GNAT family N-acetyltransferase n=1 Tax=Micrococcus lylae TaxID=1273 RepID=UPI0021A50AF1|nr:GNAT family protein [Micrococcus lylae]MCT2007827.1 GNAT family N-acetyltransferase [Micrococcus lylae]MCT2071531.1 GNAT family N-acetyltransferase [Micrococcus lylae]
MPSPTPADLYLRPLRADDADTAAVLAAFTADPDGMSRQGPVQDAQSARAYVEHLAGNAALEATAVCDAHGLAGLVTVQRDETNLSGWVAYWMHPRLRGTGATGLAVATVADRALTDGGLGRLELGHRANNPASGGVARRAGFTPEGTQRGYFLIDGVRHDVHLWGRLAEDPPSGVEPLPLRG